MGQLIEMPFDEMGRGCDAGVMKGYKNLEKSPSAPIDFSVWRNAPRERTPGYFPVYSAVSRAIQSELRVWVREWLENNLEILKTPHTAYGVLVYLCTHPFAGRPTNIFTYDIQETITLDRAFRSSASKLKQYLKTLDTKRFPWFTREHYFAYRGSEVAAYVAKNPRVLYRMLHVETMLMDAMLRFSIIDLPELGMEDAMTKLRRTFRIQLRRFSNLFDLSVREENLLRTATEALVEKLNTTSVLRPVKVA